MRNRRRLGVVSLVWAIPWQSATAFWGPDSCRSSLARFGRDGAGSSRAAAGLFRRRGIARFLPHQFSRTASRPVAGPDY